MPAKSKPIRLRVSRAVSFIVPGFAFLASLPALSAYVSHPHRNAALAFAPYLWLAIVAMGLFSSSWLGVNLTPDELVINNLRRRRIPWSQIQAITIEKSGSGQRVVIWTSDRTRIPLRAPATPFPRVKERFERQYAQLGEWWVEHRGPDWQPNYAIPARR